jgi:hypothetical protein
MDAPAQDRRRRGRDGGRRMAGRGGSSHAGAAVMDRRVPTVEDPGATARDDRVEAAAGRHADSAVADANTDADTDTDTDSNSNSDANFNTNTRSC